MTRTYALQDDIEHVDFVEHFPAPQDERLHEAGRQGLLDQKEDPAVSDAQWVAEQHRAWIGELSSLTIGVHWLETCLTQGIDPATERPPRRAEHWPRLAARLREEQNSLRTQLDGVLGDYANHFGERAAARFAVFIDACTQGGDVAGVAQARLFE